MNIALHSRLFSKRSSLHLNLSHLIFLFWHIIFINCNKFDKRWWNNKIILKFLENSIALIILINYRKFIFDNFFKLFIIYFIIFVVLFKKFPMNLRRDEQRKWLNYILPVKYADHIVSTPRPALQWELVILKPGFIWCSWIFKFDIM